MCDGFRSPAGKAYMLRFLPFLEVPDGRTVEEVLGYNPTRGFGYGRWEEFYSTGTEARARLAFLVNIGAIEDAEIRTDRGPIEVWPDTPG